MQQVGIAGLDMQLLQPDGLCPPHIVFEGLLHTKVGDNERSRGFQLRHATCGVLHHVRARADHISPIKVQLQSLDCCQRGTGCAAPRQLHHREGRVADDAKCAKLRGKLKLLVHGVEEGPGRPKIAKVVVYEEVQVYRKAPAASQMLPQRWHGFGVAATAAVVQTWGVWSMISLQDLQT